MNPSKIPTKEELEALISQGKGGKDLMAHYGVCRRTIEHWRQKLGVTIRARKGGTPKRLRYETMDRLIKQGLSTKLIAERCHCSIMAVSNRRARKDRRVRVGGYDDVSTPLIDPTKRLELALPSIARRFPGKDTVWIENVWLKGPAGKEFMRAGGYL